MSFNARLLERIEQAHTDQPFCRSCGAPMAVVDRDSGVWLVCSSPPPTSLPGRILGWLTAHDEVLVIHPRELALLVETRRAHLRPVRS